MEVRFGRITLRCFILLLWMLTPLAARATDPLPAEGGTPEPAPADTALIAADTLPRRGFFNKIMAYFEGSNQDRTFERKMDFSILPGPHYSSDIGFGLGMVASGLFRIDRADSITPVSNVSLVGDIATSGFWMLGIRGNTFFNKGDFRLDYKISYNTTPEATYWGRGYDMGRRDENESEFRRKEIAVNLDFMWRFARNLYVGAGADFNHFNSKELDTSLLGDMDRETVTSAGPGAFFMYDSRDCITAPYRGWLVKAESSVYPKALGNKRRFSRTELTVDFYHSLWKDAILAYDLHGMYNDGSHVPWTMLAQAGGSSRMRGYYEGRYRDRGIVEFQAELRQRIWRRIGAVAWVGAANVFPSFGRFDIDHTLPDYGAGLRWEFKKRVNVRLDFGFGKEGNAIIFNINEAF